MNLPSWKRGKETYKTNVATSDFYKYYRDNYEGPESRYNLGQKLYRRIISKFNYRISEKIVGENWDFHIPKRLGTIGIRKRKPTPKEDEEGNKYIPRQVDWYETRKLWAKDPEARKNKKLVKFLNKHTKGYFFTVKYMKHRCNFKNTSVYGFKPVRGLKKRLADNVFNGTIKDAYEY